MIGIIDMHICKGSSFLRVMPFINLVVLNAYLAIHSVYEIRERLLFEIAIFFLIMNVTILLGEDCVYTPSQV